MVAELARCQESNGGGWAGSIPEKYLDFIAHGHGIWAPHYTLHEIVDEPYTVYFPIRPRK